MLFGSVAIDGLVVFDLACRSSFEKRSDYASFPSQRSGTSKLRMTSMSSKQVAVLLVGGYACDASRPMRIVHRVVHVRSMGFGCRCMYHARGRLLGMCRGSQCLPGGLAFGSDL